MGIVELTPLLYAEAASAGVDLHAHWLPGGYPDACLESSAERRVRWQESYVQTTVERDLRSKTSRPRPST